MSTVLPYKVKLSSNGDIFHCTKCNKSCKLDSLWLAEMVQSTEKDAMIPKWSHIECFFSTARPITVHDLDGFAKLCNKDRANIKQRLNNSSQQTRKRHASYSAPLPAKKFAVNYAPGQNVCHSCFETIESNDIRMKKIIRENGHGNDDSAVWYHLDCFSEHSSTLGWSKHIKYMPGLKHLTNNDQTIVKRKFTANDEDRDENNNEPPAKKCKTGTIDDVNEIIESVILHQNNKLFHLRAELKQYVSLVDLIALLKANRQFVPKEISDIFDHVTDVMYFGALEKCNKCKNGHFIFDNSAYVCTGHLTAYANCNNMMKEPKRKAVTIPSDIAATYPTLMRTHTFQVRNRAILINPANTVDAINVNAPLADLEFVIVGRLRMRMEIKEKIHKLGGKVSLVVTNKTAAVIANEAEIKTGGYLMDQAVQFGIQVVPEHFPSSLGRANPFDVITKMNLSDWSCTDPAERTQRTGAIVHKFDRSYTESVPKVQKWKNGMVFDAECNLKNVHVYSNGNINYIAILSLVDIASNKNSYYRMQLLQSNDLKRCWIFSKHGRISTNIGTTKLCEYKSINVALAVFHQTFFELTGRTFTDRSKKLPNKYKVLHIQFDRMEKVLNNLVSSKLQPSIYRLMNFIDTKNTMTNGMFKFELDTNLVPLGKPSQFQIQRASVILEKLSVLVKSNGPLNQLIEASNRFYTLIPHAFGCHPPPVINTAGMIANKLLMLNRIRQLKFTYTFSSERGERNPLDCLYEKLNCDINVLDENSHEYDEIRKYVMNTRLEASIFDHAEISHLEKVYKVSRHGEAERFKPHETNFNRQLLWHGSPIENFVGILSNGLLIEPPGVHIKPYFYGRGIYFADSVTNSASYCQSEGSPDNRILLLLCEVALGKCDLQYHMSSHLQVAKDCMSVKAVGQYRPESFYVCENGLKIPNGKLVANSKIPNHSDDEDDDDETDAELNEYVACDPSQVKIRYLVKIRMRE